MSNLVLLIDDLGSGGAALLMRLAKFTGLPLVEIRERIGSGSPLLDAPLFEGEDSYADRLLTLLGELDAASATWRAFEVPHGDVWSADEDFWEITPDGLANLIQLNADIAAQTAEQVERELGLKD